jgi:Fic family protein
MWQNSLSYKITDQILLNIVALEKNLALISQTEVPDKIRERISQEVLHDDLFTLSNILKFDITLSEIKKISLGKGVETNETRVMLNVKQVFDYVQNNFKKEPLIFNFQLVQHVIKLLHSDILEVWDVGKLRSGGESPDKNYELVNQQYYQNDVVNILAEAVLWVESEENVHPLIKACIFMMFINTVSPFVGLNFISSLVFFRLILEKYNYGNNFNIPLFKVFCHKEERVSDLVNQALSGNSNTSLTDIISQISTNLNDITTKYKSERIQFDYSDIKKSSTQLDLNERQLKLLKLLQQKINIKRREYIKLFKVSPMTAYRDLNYLLEQKLLKVSGEGKATKYTLSTHV